MVYCDFNGISVVISYGVRRIRCVFAASVALVLIASCAKPSSTVFTTIDTEPSLVESPSIVETVRIVIPQVSRLSQIATILSSSGFGSKAQLLGAMHSAELLKEFAKNSSSIEGYIIAGEYSVAKGLDAVDTIRSLLEQSRRVYQAPERVIKAEYFGVNSHKLLVLASILNKETCGIGEFRRMASVLHNRLAIGMPLQVDATLVYFLNKPGTQLSKADVQTPSPYNTYLNKGLPPSPICSPSLAAIDAVLDPEMSGYLYFYSSGRCQHQFSKNYRAHKVAIRDLRPNPTTVVTRNQPPPVPSISRKVSSEVAKDSSRTSVWDLFGLRPKRN